MVTAEERHKAMLWELHLKKLEERKKPKSKRAKLTPEERKERIRATKKAYRERNREKINEYNREYQRRRRAEMTDEERRLATERANEWQRRKYATDPEFRQMKLARNKERCERKKKEGQWGSGR